jgi:hypothetical protein
MQRLGLLRVLLLSIYSTLTIGLDTVEGLGQISLIDEKPYLPASVEVRLPPSMTPDFGLNKSWTGPPEVGPTPVRELRRLENLLTIWRFASTGLAVRQLENCVE